MEYHPGSFIAAGEMRIPIISLATGKRSEEELKVALDAALEAGCRRIKTTFAECKLLGSILKEMFESNKIAREDIFISAMLPAIGSRYEDVEYFLTKTLDDLQLDYVDMYEFGSPMGLKRQGDTLVPLDEDGEVLLDLKTDIVATWKGLEEQVAAGRARSLGLCCFNENQIERILNSCTIRPVSLTIELHVYLQMKETVLFCKENGIVVTAVAPLGCLGQIDILTGSNRRKSALRSPMRNPVVKEIASKYNKRPSQVLLRFLVQYGVTIAIKSVNPKRLKECFSIFDFELTQEEYDRLADLNSDEYEMRTTSACCSGIGILQGFEKHPEFPWIK